MDPLAIPDIQKCPSMKRHMDLKEVEAPIPESPALEALGHRSKE